MPDHDRVADLVKGVIDLIMMDLPPDVVANHVALVLSGWAATASGSGDLHRQFVAVRDELANGLNAEFVALTQQAETAPAAEAERVQARIAAVLAARDAALAVTAS